MWDQHFNCDRKITRSLKIDVNQANCLSIQWRTTCPVITSCIISACGTFLPTAWHFPKRISTSTWWYTTSHSGISYKDQWTICGDHEALHSVLRQQWRQFFTTKSRQIWKPSLYCGDRHSKGEGGIMSALPRHTSNKLQPLDVWKFSSFKWFYQILILFVTKEIHCQYMMQLMLWLMPIFLLQENWDLSIWSKCFHWWWFHDQ